MHRTVSVSIKQPLRLKSLFFFALSVPVLFSQAEIPEWCHALPRPEYKVLQRVPISYPWFEVYKVAPAVFAIYEPHQSEEVISYLIVGDKRAALFDTGMGISDLKKVTSELTRLPIVVLNSHTHNDHVGDNWRFDTIYAMDTDFTRRTPSLSSNAPTVCSLRATHTIPLPSGYTVPKPIWKPMLPRSADLQPLRRK